MIRPSANPSSSATKTSGTSTKLDEEVEALFKQLANQDDKDDEEETLRRLYDVFSDMLEDMLEAAVPNPFEPF